MTVPPECLRGSEPSLADRAMPDSLHGGSMHLVITGADGYIGQRLTAQAAAHGVAVTVLARRPGVRRVVWSLGLPVPDAAFARDPVAGPVDAVIHLAHHWTTEGDEAADPNIGGTAALLAAARRHGVPRFVFASSLSAQPAALNRYGRVQWRIEQLLSGTGEIAARIGLVYGGPRRGMWGTLCRIASLGPVVPMVTPWRQVQPIHLDDLCRGLLLLAGAPGPVTDPAHGVAVLADPEPLSFSRFLSLVARQVADRHLVVLPVPLAPILVILHLVNRLPFLPRVERERVLGLAGLPVVASGDSLRRLGLTLRPLEAGLAAERPGRHHDRRRRALIREGLVLLGYVRGRSPEPALVRRYVRAVEVHGTGIPLPMPGLLAGWPRLMRLVEPLPASRTPGQRLLSERLHIAALLVDATPDGGRRYDYRGESPVSAVLRLFVIVALEVVAMPFRLTLARRIWR